jgi:peptide/nickel transport system substrate-binding protein
VSKIFRVLTRLTHAPYVALLLIAIHACSPPPPSPGPSDRVVVAIESAPGALDPRFATDANAVRIGRLVFNGLTRVDPDLRVRPELAVGWEIPEPTTYIFELRRGVRFHDGGPFTSADVRYTYESIRDPSTRSPKRSLFEILRAVEPLGPHRVRFRLHAPYAPLLDYLSLGIVSREGRERLAGTGPFAVERHVPGEKVLLKANPLYWEGQPRLAGLAFRVVPDALVRVLEIKKASVHLLQNDIEPDMLPWIRKHTAASLTAIPGSTFQYIGINLEHPPLRSVRVRQALAHALDRETIIRHLLKGLADPASGLLYPGHWAHEPQIAVWPHDPERAKSLLDEAGFPDPDGDGPLPRFKLSFKTTTLDFRRRLAEAFKEQLARVGIALEISTYEWGTFYEDVKKGNFHLYSLAWVGVTDPDVYYLLFHSRSVPPNGNNRGRYRNPEVDRLLESARHTLDEAARRRAYAQVQKILAWELPYVPLWWTKNVMVSHPALRGLVPFHDGDLISLKDASLSPAP